MKKIDIRDISGTWRSYKMEFNGEEKMLNDFNWTEWKFSENGHASLSICRDNRLITDPEPKSWSISQNKNFYELSISGQLRYEIIDVNEEFLVLKNQSGIIYYFAEIKKYDSLLKG